MLGLHLNLYLYSAPPKSNSCSSSNSKEPRGDKAEGGWGVGWGGGWRGEMNELVEEEEK